MPFSDKFIAKHRNWNNLVSVYKLSCVVNLFPHWFQFQLHFLQITSVAFQEKFHFFMILNFSFWKQQHWDQQSKELSKALSKFLNYTKISAYINSLSWSSNYLSTNKKQHFGKVLFWAFSRARSRARPFFIKHFNYTKISFFMMPNFYFWKQQHYPHILFWALSRARS